MTNFGPSVHMCRAVSRYPPPFHCIPLVSLTFSLKAPCLVSLEPPHKAPQNPPAQRVHLAHQMPRCQRCLFELEKWEFHQIWWFYIPRCRSWRIFQLVKSVERSKVGLSIALKFHGIQVGHPHHHHPERSAALMPHADAQPDKTEFQNTKVSESQRSTSSVMWSTWSLLPYCCSNTQLASAWENSLHPNAWHSSFPGCLGWSVDHFISYSAKHAIRLCTAPRHHPWIFGRTTANSGQIWLKGPHKIYVKKHLFPYMYIYIYVYRLCWSVHLGRSTSHQTKPGHHMKIP